MNPQIMIDAYPLLHSFYNLAFQALPFKFSFPLARSLSDVVSNLEKSDFKAAREILNKAYDALKNLIIDSITYGEKSECQIALCQTLYLKEAVILEDFELRAGLTVLFKRLGLDTGSYFEKYVDFYSKFDLGSEFYSSAWKEDLLKIIQEKAGSGLLQSVCPPPDASDESLRLLA